MTTWTVYDGDHIKMARTHAGRIRHWLCLCAFWRAWRLLQPADSAFVDLLRRQFIDDDMPITRGQYRRLERLAQFAHRVYEQGAFSGSTTPVSVQRNRAARASAAVDKNVQA